MAEITTIANSSGVLSGVSFKGGPTRKLEVYIDFDAGDVTMANATDTITLATLPKGTVVYGGGIEQITVGTGTGTLQPRIGTTALCTALTSTDAAGTIEAHADVSGGAPLFTVNATTKWDLLGATATRADGKIRVWLFVSENRGGDEAGLATRDYLA